jgi:hypothetical protein
MKYEIKRNDFAPMGALARLRLIPESESERGMLKEVEKEMDSQFGRGRYHLAADPTNEGLVFKVLLKDRQWQNVNRIRQYGKY